VKAAPIATHARIIDRHPEIVVDHEAPGNGRRQRKGGISLLVDVQGEPAVGRGLIDGTRHQVCGPGIGEGLVLRVLLREEEGQTLGITADRRLQGNAARDADGQ